jgi:hypothetical protein
MKRIQAQSTFYPQEFLSFYLKAPKQFLEPFPLSYLKKANRLLRLKASNLCRIFPTAKFPLISCFRFKAQQALC